MGTLFLGHPVGCNLKLYILWQPCTHYFYKPALINAIVDTLTPHTLTAAIMEPPVTGGSHTGAGGLALVP